MFIIRQETMNSTRIISLAFFLKVLVVGIFSSWQRFGGEMGNMLTELKKRYNVKT